MNLSSLNHFLRTLLLTCVACVAMFSLTANSAEPVKIGVLSFRPKPQTQAQWQPLATALKKANPEYEFIVEAYTYPELEKATASNQLDFVLTNPAHYILLTKRYGLSAPLATLATLENNQRLTVFGGVVFTRANRVDINTLHDIKHKSVAATEFESFGGYLAQANELNKIGIDVKKNNKVIITGMPHDNVVNAVLDGQADVGFVRTGVLESLASDGKLDMHQIKIINLQNIEHFPLQASTPLYPEWAFASMPHVDENLARHVAAALFNLEENTVATKAIHIHGFVVPANYSRVENVLQALRVKPFDEAPVFNTSDVWKQYRRLLIGALFALGLIVILWAWLLLTKRQLETERQLMLDQQKRLKESDAHLRTIINSEPECIKVVDAHGNLIEMNPAGLAMLEADSLTKLAGQPMLNFIAPEYRTAFSQMHKRVLAGASEQMEFEMIGLKGGRRWMETHAVPLEENGSIVHLALTRDITESKRTEASLKENEERLALATIINGIGVWDWDLQTMQLVWDDSMFALYNLKREDFNSAFEAWEKTLHPDDRERVAQEAKDAILGKKPFNSEFRIIWLNGEIRHIKAVAKVFYDDVGEPLRMLGSNVDVTERKTAEAQLHMLSIAIEQSPTSVAITNLDAEIEYVNPRFTKVTGYSSDEAIGKNPRVLQSGLTDKSVYEDLWSKLTQGKRWEGEFINKDKNGEIFYEDAYISPVTDDDGTVNHYVAVKLDVTKRKKIEEEVRQLAFYDTLTKLPNRRLLNDRLSQVIAASKRSGSYGALMFLDLDNFKQLNDTHGHEVGDMLLIEAANRLTSCIREMDTIARFGGDEFVVMLSELGVDKVISSSQAAIVAEKIRAALSAPYKFTVSHGDQSNTAVEHLCSGSIGAIVFNGIEGSQDDLMKWADAAMYDAKGAGGNQIRFYVVKG